MSWGSDKKNINIRLEDRPSPAGSSGKSALADRFEGLFQREVGRSGWFREYGKAGITPRQGLL